MNGLKSSPNRKAALPTNHRRARAINGSLRRSSSLHPALRCIVYPFTFLPRLPPYILPFAALFNASELV